LKGFGSQTKNSLLFPVPKSKIVKSGQKSRVSRRNQEKSLLISLLIGGGRKSALNFVAKQIGDSFQLSPKNGYAKSKAIPV
jgi:hypothetical protein